MPKKKPVTFAAGDAVTWTSSYTVKRGTVVRVVPAGTYPQMGLLCDELRARSAYGGGSTRDHESYVVLVPQGTTGKAKPILYWPVASLLKPAGKAPARAGSRAAA